MKKNKISCPVWVRRLITIPFRKLVQNPDKILELHIKPGMKVLEVGPSLGFFSIPMAKRVGAQGKIYCVDIQASYLEELEKRAQKAGVEKQIETRLNSPISLQIHDLNEKLDFAFLFSVVHEVQNQLNLFIELSLSLKPGSKVLFCEPQSLVSKVIFEESLRIAKRCSLKLVKTLKIKGSHAALLIKDE